MGHLDMPLSRRQFLARLGRLPAAGALLAGGTGRSTPTRTALGFADPGAEWRGDSSVTAALRAGRMAPLSVPTARVAPSLDWDSVGATLRARYRDLRRHFIFEYYPWYGVNPWRHWNEADRVPPIDLASNFMPVLGAYDSTDSRVLEQHAEWIAASGAGAVNLSWWGQGSDPDRAVPFVMDVMRAHGIHVTFHLEPYTDRRTEAYARDVLYLLKEYGERRHWDCFLLMEDANGHSGPVFKSFRTILPRTVTDCHGVTYPVPDYTADSDWRRVTDSLRRQLRTDFDRVTLLADSLDLGRTAASGFDGIAVYDNYVEPGQWQPFANGCASRGLVFSFNTNPGVDTIVQRHVAPDSCYTPPRIIPDASGDGGKLPDRDKMTLLVRDRIKESITTTVALQVDPSLANVPRGFFLVYLNSFNEWHEGHQFEPMKNERDLTAPERAVGYHNPPLGGYRLEALRGHLGRLLG
jgi:hypothetical protein